jgi:UDP-N-acetylmuramyl tripeptide synthase
VTNPSRRIALSRLAQVVDRRITGDSDPAILDIAYDSREVTPGSLFVALRGGYVDGHSYIDQAIERGAVALLVERPGPYPVPAIVVQDSRAALSPVAAEFFGHPSREVKVAGVTGTDGKTSTSTLAEAMLNRVDRNRFDQDRRRGGRPRNAADNPGVARNPALAPAHGRLRR